MFRPASATAVVRIFTSAQWFADANCLFNGIVHVHLSASCNLYGIVVAHVNFSREIDHETCHWMERVIATLRFDRGFRGFTVRRMRQIESMLLPDASRRKLPGYYRIHITRRYSSLSPQPSRKLNNSCLGSAFIAFTETLMAISFSSPSDDHEASILEHLESGFKRKKRSIMGILVQPSFAHRDEKHGRTRSTSVDDILQREALMGSSIRELTQSEINAVRSGSKVK